MRRTTTVAGIAPEQTSCTHLERLLFEKNKAPANVDGVEFTLVDGKEAWDSERIGWDNDIGVCIAQLLKRSKIVAQK